MKDKDNSRIEAAGQVFRQFAWNLAGTLPRPSRPGKAGGAASTGGKR